MSIAATSAAAPVDAGTARRPVRVLDLFAGVGGWSLALHRRGLVTVAACEADAWKRRHYARHFPSVPIYPDVRDLTAEVLDRDGLLPIDWIVGSPPCTDISTANTSGAGVDGPESRLYFEATRIVGEVRPRGCAFENSANLRARGADRVLDAMEAAGYAVWPLVVGAAHAGASHRRLRSWLVGYRRDLLGATSDADGERRRGRRRQGDDDRPQSQGRATQGACADTDGPGLRHEPRWRGGAGRQGASLAAADAADADREGQHVLAEHVEVGGRRGDAGPAVADRTGGGGNDADSDRARRPQPEVLARYSEPELAAIERGFGLDWSDGPGALARSLRAADGVSARLAAAGPRERRRIAAELARGRSAYGDAVAIPVVEAVVDGLVALDRECSGMTGEIT